MIFSSERQSRHRRLPETALSFFSDRAQSPFCASMAVSMDTATCLTQYSDPFPDEEDGSALPTGSSSIG